MSDAAIRLDVLLFELRLFKSRSQAGTAIRLGRALLNGARVKPSHAARAGDRVTLLRTDAGEGPARERTLEILELPHASLSREAARAMVREAPPG